MSVGPLEIWTALRQAGASAVQAAGIMGNMIAESSLNPEASVVDSNGKPSYGLIQWNTGSYPGASGLVTGNPASDLKNQVAFLASTGGFKAAQGNTAEQVAANFAHSYERCSACGYQGGTGELTKRSANASRIWAMAQSSSWSAVTGAITGTANVGATQPISGQAGVVTNATGGTGCGAKGEVFHIPIPFSGGLGFTWCQAKALNGGLLMLGGVILGLAGLLVLARGAVAQAAGQVASKAGPAGAAASIVADKTGAKEAGLTPKQTIPKPAGLKKPGPATGNTDRAKAKKNRAAGSEAYDAGYQRAMMDHESRARELEVPF